MSSECSLYALPCPGSFRHQNNMTVILGVGSLTQGQRRKESARSMEAALRVTELSLENSLVYLGSTEQKLQFLQHESSCIIAGVCVHLLEGG